MTSFSENSGKENCKKLKTRKMWTCKNGTSVEWIHLVLFIFNQNNFKKGVCENESSLILRLLIFFQPRFYKTIFKLFNNDSLRISIGFLARKIISR